MVSVAKFCPLSDANGRQLIMTSCPKSEGIAQLWDAETGQQIPLITERDR